MTEKDLRKQSHCGTEHHTETNINHTDLGSYSNKVVILASLLTYVVLVTYVVFMSQKCSIDVPHPFITQVYRKIF